MSKAQIIAKFDELFGKSKQFESEAMPGQNLAIFIRWIGYDFDLSSDGNFGKYKFESMSW